MTSAIPVQRSTNWANKPTGSWSMNWVQINIQVNDDFRNMKIHIFALRWRDEIKRSSQLRTLLKQILGTSTLETRWILLERSLFSCRKTLRNGIELRQYRYLNMRRLKNLSPLNNLSHGIFFSVDLFFRRRRPMNITGAVVGTLDFIT